MTSETRPQTSLVATVRRRALVTHRVDPGRAAAVLPSGMVPIIHEGHAFVSLCYSDIQELRPAFVPAIFGISFQYLVTRMLVRVTPRVGPPFVAAHVLEALADSAVVRVGARFSYRLAMKPARIELRDDEGTWRLSGRVADELVTECELRVGPEQDSLRGSVFGSRREAFDTMLSMTRGTHVGRRPDLARVLTQTFDPTAIETGQVRGRSLPRAASLGLGEVEPDHALMGCNVPYRYGARAQTVLLPRRISRS